MVDRVAPVRRAERLFVHRAPQQDGLAAGAGLLGRHPGERPRERSRPANRRQGVLPARDRLSPSGPFLVRRRVDERAMGPAVAADRLLDRLDVAAGLGVPSLLAVFGESFARPRKQHGCEMRIVPQPGVA